MDIYAKILIVNWIIITTCAFTDKHMLSYKLIDVPYLGISLAFYAWVNVLLTPTYLIYFVITVL